jgi:hypothetical protein
MKQSYAYNTAGLILVITGAALAILNRDVNEYLALVTAGTTVLGRGKA